jgi:hypothetical protein
MNRRVMRQNASRDWIRFSLVTLAIYFALQAVIILAHEYAHSTAAWLLGYTPTPLTVIWGNLVTMRGWDEGVPYDQLFPSGGKPAEALIGGIPLLMHAVFVVMCLYLLQRRTTTERRPLFYVLYWFVVINLAELFSYIVMRPFAGGGDTGRFNQGLRLSPWFLLVAGTVFLVIALWILLARVMPRLDAVAGGNQVTHWIVVCFTAFILFLWGSGLRILSLYPDRQWKTGLIGVVAFFVWVLADHLRTSSQSA